MRSRNREVKRNQRTYSTLELRASFKCGICEEQNEDKKVEVFTGWGCDEELGCNSGVEAKCGFCNAVNRGI